MNVQRNDHLELSVAKTTLTLLAMMAERYLTLEDENSSKMALEITAGWDCKTVV